jgi:iron complex transport system permease protein
VKGHYGRAVTLLALALPVILIIAAGTGAYYIPPWKIPWILWHHAEEDGYRVLAYIRFPRVVLAAVVGAALACSGACLQGLFRNPLAEPQLIGVTGGAAVGAAVWLLLVSSPVASQWGLPIAAFGSSAITVFIVWLIAERADTRSPLMLVLAGIAINSIAFALIGLLVSIADNEKLRSFSFWQLGSFGYATWPITLWTAGLAGAGILLLLGSGKALNALALGQTEAFHLGISPARAKRRIIVGCALSVGAGVAASGAISFVGLVVPHLIRIGIGADHRWLLPASALGGASLMVAADLGARTIAQPTELPVGILTALAGGPFFIWLLLRSRKEAMHA